MGQIVSLADFRRDKLKASLCKLARSGSPVIVETRTTTIAAMKIFCRDLFAILIDKFGYQNSVNYSEITDISPMLPMTDKVRSAGSQIADGYMHPMRPVVVSFRRPAAR